MYNLAISRNNIAILRKVRVMKNYNEKINYSPIEFRYNIPCFFHDESISAEIEIKNWHEEIEFFYVLDGFGEVICDSENIPVSKDEFCTINPFTIHNAKSTTKMHFYNIGINSDFCKFNGINIHDFTFEKRFTDNIAFEKLKKIRDIYFEQRFQPFYYAELCNALLDFVLYITKNHAKKSDIKINNNIMLSVMYIKSNLTKKLTIDDVCSQSGLSKYHFSREFKKATGYTVINYINLLRCQKACQYLNTKNYTVNDVFQMFPFDSLSHFTKVFKTHIGVSPTEYVKNIR